jgi:hypothetical protein
VKCCCDGDSGRLGAKTSEVYVYFVLWLLWITQHVG